MSFLDLSKVTSRLLPESGDSRLLAFGGGCEAKSRDDLRRLALGISEQLTPKSEVLLLCEDRYSFLASLLGALEAGATAILPPHRGSAAREFLARGRVIFSDDAEEGAFSVPSLSPLEDGREGRSFAPSDVLLTLYTSGTTGEPSAVPKTFAQLVGEADALAAHLGLDEGSRVVSTVSPQHIYGLLFGILAPLRSGGSFLRRTSHLTAGIEEEIAQHDASVLVGVPAHLEGLFSERDYPKHLGVVSSGARLPDAVMARIVQGGARVWDVLGSSETGGYAFRSEVSPYFSVFPHARLEVDAAGTTLLTSPFLDEPTRPFRLSDALEFDALGRFRHLGRSDDVVKVGGKRVNLGEIEAAARGLRGVADAACLSERTDTLRGELIELYVVAPGYTEAILKEALRHHLDPVFVPRRVVRVDSIPRSANGKIERSRLRRLRDVAPPDSRLTFEPEFVSEPRNDAVTLTCVVSRAHPRFRGHFPKEPLLPAVSELHDIVLPAVEKIFGRIGFVRSISRWKLMAPLRPGAKVEVSLVRKGSRVEFSLGADGKTLTRGALEFSEATLESSKEGGA